MGLLKTYRKILFDAEGTIISSVQFENAAALTLFEMINKEVDVEWCEQNVEKIKKLVFCNGKTVESLKARGINTDCDMAYVAYMVALIAKAREIPDEDIYDFIYSYTEEIPVTAPELFVYVINNVMKLYDFDIEFLKRQGTLWLRIQDVFNQWYLGDAYYEKVNGSLPEKPLERSGLIRNEMPLCEAEDLKAVLSVLKDNDIRLAIVSDREDYEIKIPLENWGVIEFFEEDSIVTSTVLNGVESKEISIARPHPFAFLKAAFGSEKSDEELISFEGEVEDVAVLSANTSAITSVRTAGMGFVAILPEVDTEQAKENFENLDSDYIFHSVTDILKNEKRR